MDATIPTVRFADVLHLARQHDASDIHLVPGLMPALRVDGDLRFLPELRSLRATLRR